MAELLFKLTLCHATFRSDSRHLCTKLALVPGLASDEPNEEEAT